MGPERKRVTYDQLTQAQLSTGLLNIIDAEQNQTAKSNMIKLAAALHQDMVDHSYIPAHGALAVCLSAIEEGRVTWENYDTLLALKNQYLLTTDSRTIISNTERPNQTSDNSQVRLCKNFNKGNCTFHHGHTQAGVSYNHYCQFCVKQGALFSHSESVCRKRMAQLEPPEIQA